MKNCNKFDNVCLDIEKEFQKQDKILEQRPENGAQMVSALSAFLGLVKMYFLGFLYKTGILKRLFFGNLALGWFNEFRKFWVDYLGNRPIDVFDFHFLKGVYRAKFQEVSLRNEKTSEEFVKSWQGAANLYLLFQGVWNYSQRAYLNFYPFLKHIPRKASILEFGCGIAPITTGLMNYCSYKKLKFTIADIKQINFLYARWKLGRYENVKFLTLDPAKNDSLPSNEFYDVIVCLAVFEHLPNPFQTAHNFFNHLKGGGVLIFDYAKQEAAGLDTRAGQEERGRVLQFIEENFKIIKGKIDYEKSAGLIIAQKKWKK